MSERAGEQANRDGRSVTYVVAVPPVEVVDDGRTNLARCAVVGAGRLGRALTAAWPDLAGPFGRGFDGGGFDVVLLAVPDREIGHAAAAIAAGPLVGHCSGATGLDVLAPHERFGVHPLMTFVPGGDAGSAFRGAAAAVGGSTEHALAVAMAIAHRLGMHPFELADGDRAAYHAAASIASNLLVTIEDAAEVLLATVGQAREILLPLIRASVENWAASGRAALTGPVARGDDETVARQRAAIAERAPELLALFDALVTRTRAVVADGVRGE
jgi:predicted short-subunit dehydrogenase-like oxidoreductase (DUF2520 family)